MTAIDDWISELQKFRGSANVAPLFSDVDTVVAALQALNDALTTVSTTYTPVLTNTTNIAASTPFLTNYLRVGNTVHVSGMVNIDPTAASVQTTLGISLPVASNFANTYDLAGTANRGFVSTLLNIPAVIFADVANDRATLDFLDDTDLAARDWFFLFTYRVII